MEHFQELLQQLEKKSGQQSGYRIPACWNTVDYPYEPSVQEGVQLVDPYGFYAAVLRSIAESEEIPLPQGIAGSVLYSLMPRAATAFVHRRGEGILNGSFLKCICLLPLMKRMGVDILYLLPVFTVSEMFQKGELSSPYAIRDIMSLDPSLGDSLLSGVKIETQFAALVEACHHMGIRVMLDFVFRTAARDNVLAAEHPEWFYWVRADKAQEMSPPGIEGMGQQVVSRENVQMLYDSPQMEKFVSCFVPTPGPLCWRAISADAAQKGKNIMKQAVEELGICTLTGFADTINDPQPPWTDVTYLKLYYDHSDAAKKRFDCSKMPPFLAQDGVKCSVFPGKDPNLPLWEYLRDVIPHYIRCFGIDGARVDMGHALPEELNRAIVAAAKQEKPDFFFWSEEFSPKNAAKAKAQGSAFITGDLWTRWKDFSGGRLSIQIAQSLKSSLPVTAAAEMADTPRAPVLTGGIREAGLCAMITALLPNSVMMINNGQELLEMQPMNLGLLNSEEGRYVLPMDDPMYGKLAFFDRVTFHWTQRTAGHMQSFLADMARLRNRYRHLLTDPDAFNREALAVRGHLTVLSYEKDGKGMAAVINRGRRTQELDLHKLTRGRFGEQAKFRPVYHIGTLKEMQLAARSAAVFEIEEEQV
ncbi:MAG: alpha amylase [Clostridiales bacterium]|nr:alpha amylase [Clostridiales bacterium]